jgi:hypothetical protein
VCLSLAGCGSIEKHFENRLIVSLSGDRAFVASMYGPIGITAELSAEDARELAKLKRQATATK